MIRFLVDTSSDYTVDEVKEKGMELLHVEEFQSITGQGIKAVLEGQTYLIGNKKLCIEQNIDYSEYDTLASVNQ